MKKCKYAIFDMDGTLIDSMIIWKDLGKEYLRIKGIKAPENLNEILSAMSMTESSEYFRKTYGIGDSVEKIISDINKIIESKYKYEIELKNNVREYLSHLKAKGVTMCVTTATPLELANGVLKRLGILNYFSFVACCDEVGYGKNRPDIFYYALEKMKADIKDTVVYEDADYALETAKKAGFYTIGVYDESAAKSKEEIKNLCNEYIESF
ncbi:HAD family hydrolase [Haloimpatiens sp. FM7315]|uniref:HAD family hydrolase n=1 Tax=Haloimpatiens sp. FM7315 TaxID=3298609 RepID=UPI0035A2911D